MLYYRYHHDDGQPRWVSCKFTVVMSWLLFFKFLPGLTIFPLTQETRNKRKFLAQNDTPTTGYWINIIPSDAIFRGPTCNGNDIVPKGPGKKKKKKKIADDCQWVPKSSDGLSPLSEIWAHRSCVSCLEIFNSVTRLIAHPETGTTNQFFDRQWDTCLGPLLSSLVTMDWLSTLGYVELYSFLWRLWFWAIGLSSPIFSDDLFLKSYKKAHVHASLLHSLNTTTIWCFQLNQNSNRYCCNLIHLLPMNLNVSPPFV